MSKEIAEKIKKPYRFTIVDVIQLAENYLALEAEADRMKQEMQSIGQENEQLKKLTRKKIIEDWNSEAEGFEFPHTIFAVACDVDRLEQENERLRDALQVFANCVEQIDDDEDEEEWAKFRLTVADYRKAANALRGEEG